MSANSFFLPAALLGGGVAYGGAQFNNGASHLRGAINSAQDLRQSTHDDVINLGNAFNAKAFAFKNASVHDAQNLGNSFREAATVFRRESIDDVARLGGAFRENFNQDVVTNIRRFKEDIMPPVHSLANKALAGVGTVFVASPIAMFGVAPMLKNRAITNGQVARINALKELLEAGALVTVGGALATMAFLKSRSRFLSTSAPRHVAAQTASPTNASQVFKDGIDFKTRTTHLSDSSRENHQSYGDSSTQCSNSFLAKVTQPMKSYWQALSSWIQFPRLGFNPSKS